MPKNKLPSKPTNHQRKFSLTDPGFTWNFCWTSAEQKLSTFIRTIYYYFGPGYLIISFIIHNEIDYSYIQASKIFRTRKLIPLRN